MSESESTLKEVNSNQKELFNFNGDDAQLKHLKEVNTHFIKNTKNGPNYFINFVEFYSLCRPNHVHITYFKYERNRLGLFDI